MGANFFEIIYILYIKKQSSYLWSPKFITKSYFFFGFNSTLNVTNFSPLPCPLTDSVHGCILK